MTSPRDPDIIWCYILSDQSGDNSTSDAWAAWLAKEIGNYSIPAKLVGRINLRGETIPDGKLTVCTTPLSMDASATITEDVVEKLGRSLNLVLLCSPGASRSPLVDQVVRTYKMSGRSTRLLAAIIAGIPHAPAAQADQECFPVATRYNVDAEGELLSTPAEPIAADFRTADGGEGWVNPTAYIDALLQSGIDEDDAQALAQAYATKVQLMKLKIIAGILGVSLGALTERDVAHQRQLQKQKRNKALLLAGTFSLLGAAGIWAGMLAWRSYDKTVNAKQLVLQSSQKTGAEITAIENARKQAEGARAAILYVEADKLLLNPDSTSRAEAEAKLLESAELGKAGAQIKIAMLLFEDKNEVEGARWLEKAIAQKYSPAITFVGECHLAGKHGFQGGRVEAIQQFLTAANMGDRTAQFNLGRLAEEGEPSLGGVAEAVKWFEKAAQAKSSLAFFELYRIYAGEIPGSQVDQAKARDYLRQAAEGGSLPAQWRWALQLEQGVGEAKDITAAVGWFRKVAEQTLNLKLAREAQRHLAVLYRDDKVKFGATRDEDVAEAIRILKALAEAGDSSACTELGHTFEHDWGRLPADATAALFWHRKSAQLGNNSAKFDVAWVLLNKLKENLSLFNATRWLNEREGLSLAGKLYPNLFLDPVHGYSAAWKEYREAEAYLKDFQSNLWSRKHLAELYLIEEFQQDGNFDKAFSLLTEASKRKDLKAKAILSVIYEQGHPPQVLADPKKAAELRKTSLTSTNGGLNTELRDYFKSKDKETKARRNFTTEYINELQQRAGRGDAKAQIELGLHFLHFQSYEATPLQLDFTKAAQQLAPGALNSDTLALMGLGLTYRQTKDLPNRFKLHLKAAQNGDEPLAQLWTGVALEEGIGTEINLIEAYKWYLVAFSYDQEGSTAAKKRVQAKMTPEQQLEARKRADGYKPIKPPTMAMTVAQVEPAGQQVEALRRVVDNKSIKSKPMIATAAQAVPASKETQPPKPTLDTKKEIKPEPINPALSGKSFNFLLEECKRLYKPSASREDLDKVLQYAQAAIAKNRNSSKVMNFAAEAAWRKGDYETMQKWLLMLATQKLGNSSEPNLNYHAMGSLSHNYEVGKGTPVDLVEAYKWHLLELLKTKNQVLNDERLTELEKRMTAAEIAEARKRAKDFRVASL